MSEASPPLSAEQVAALVGLSPQTVYRAAERGDLASYRYGRRVRFARSDVEDWLARQRRPTRVMARPRAIEVQATRTALAPDSTVLCGDGQWRLLEEARLWRAEQQEAGR